MHYLNYVFIVLVVGLDSLDLATNGSRMLLHRLEQCVYIHFLLFAGEHILQHHFA